ncbi:hypothetical protein [Xylella fastidiosa]|uniref:Uncharacterized protein n=1 Tax=Xylella fastidiosa (strain 9a5c) TaxID=160492 RepID=Q9PDY4_XYLFA|nr:hypothetical protein [Xylella fastidiosa]AAF84054.1 hypothetical protein XF_1245 [Xylella fastidiosa 9a5c]ALQ94666.1 hypothetical protein XFUD_05275 [Xylella fastidiosa]ALQ97403.1 hypothetical protein XFC3_08550 [Xylella fastidiosa]ALR01771.1 hypothetical protein OY18_05475 [Xylella fastidiosa]ALR09176.2 hypothetical protein XFFB_08175 [Xylella fastidiosa]
MTFSTFIKAMIDLFIFILNLISRTLERNQSKLHNWIIFFIIVIICCGAMFHCGRRGLSTAHQPPNAIHAEESNPPQTGYSRRIVELLISLAIACFVLLQRKYDARDIAIPFIIILIILFVAFYFAKGDRAFQ